MLSSRARTLTAIVAVALLAILSVVSASRMAPDRESLQRLAVAQVMGTVSADFCGTDGEDHAEHCPFCHKLPEPPKVAAPTLWRAAIHDIATVDESDLVTGPQHIRPDVLSRAPPVVA